MERREHLPARVVGRYAIFDAIATGGMATVCFGRLVGPRGFARTVVVKRLHPQLAADPDVTTMFQDEARIAASIHHPNVVPVIDVVEGGDELLLVMEYVHGESLAYLARAGEHRTEADTRIVVNVVAAALHGLHAAHEALGDGGRPLDVVHRDVSPQNILVGVDGVTRVVDFGVAKAAGQSHATALGQVKGKIRFLAPEQVVSAKVDRRTDVWGAAVTLWEALTRKRLFSGENDAAVMMEVLQKEIQSPRVFAPEVPEAVAGAILRGLSRDADARFPTALAMAEALEAAAGLCTVREIGAWVERAAGDRLAARRRVLDDIESETLSGPAPTAPPPRPGDEPTLTPAPATPAAPPLVTHDPPRRARAAYAGPAAAVAVALVMSLLLVRTLLRGDGRAAVSHAAVIEPTPVVSPEPPSAPTPPPSLLPSPSAPAPPVSATAPGPASATAKPPRERPRAPPSASPRADFQVPLYGRD